MTTSITLASSGVSRAVRQMQRANKDSTLLGSLQRATNLISGRTDVEPSSVPWDRIDAPLMKVLIKKMKEQGYAAATINHTMAAIKAVAKTLWLTDLLSNEQYQKVLSVKGVRPDNRPVGREIDKGEQRLLLAAAQDDRQKAIVYLFLWGLRRVEVVRLNRSDVNITDKGVELIVRGKGNKFRKVPLRGDAATVLCRLVSSHNDKPLFVGHRGKVAVGRITTRGVTKIFDEVRARSGVNGISTHDGRRTLVTNMNKAGVPLSDIAGFVGHSNVNTTIRYIREEDGRMGQVADILNEWREGE